MVTTKIIATLGPSSSSPGMLRRMFAAGLDIVRLNFSHGSHQEHLKRIQAVRTLNKTMRRAVKIMQDLEGYRIRLGRLAAPLELSKNAVLFLTKEHITGSGKLIPFDYAGPLTAIRTGSLIYIDDGRIVLKVAGRTQQQLKVKVIIGGTLKERKGINIPDARFNFDALTEKDKDDLQFAIRHRLDYVAQSFVRCAQDIISLKKILDVSHPSCRIYAKIENKDALDNLDAIIDVSDGIIVARGDLGICLPIYKVAVFQKEIIRHCRRKKKPVVVATQMLESMVEERLPTRAEVSDVTGAIFDEAAALMLSAETAVGKHPHLVVAMMNAIIKAAEQYRRSRAGKY